MKWLLTIIMMLVLFASANAQKKIEFNYPEDSTTDASKKAFVKEFNKGHVLYTINCSKCHNFQENKIQIVPDFSMPQLMDYEMRSYPEHMEKLNDTHVSDEEMQRIILFLRFKKKSGRPFPVPVQPVKATGG